MRTDRLVEPMCVSNVDANDNIRGLVIFEDYNGKCVEAHILSDGKPGWLSKKFLREMFSYSFNYLAVERITVRIDEDNAKAFKLARKMGFTLESTSRRAGGNGQDIKVMRLFKEHCRYI